MYLGCCALTELESHPYDYEGDNDWEKENYKSEWQYFRDSLRDLDRKHKYLATVNSDQLKAKAAFLKKGFQVISTFKSEEDGRPIWLLSRGLRIQSPRKKRGH